MPTFQRLGWLWEQREAPPPEAALAHLPLLAAVWVLKEQLPHSSQRYQLMLSAVKVIWRRASGWAAARWHTQFLLRLLLVMPPQ